MPIGFHLNVITRCVEKFGCHLAEVVRIPSYILLLRTSVCSEKVVGWVTYRSGCIILYHISYYMHYDGRRVL